MASLLETTIASLRTFADGRTFRTIYADPPWQFQNRTRSQVNLIRTVKREHSRKPDEMIPIIEACSPGPYLELFARGDRKGWAMWGNQAVADYEPTWNTYANHTVAMAQ